MNRSRDGSDTNRSRPWRIPLIEAPDTRIPQGNIGGEMIEYEARVGVGSASGADDHLIGAQ